MKSFLTLIFIVFIGVFANAQDSKEVKVETITTEVKLEITISTKNEVARLYLNKNTHTKKQLTFKTKRNKTKLA